jgi:hypothetical protein
MAAYALVVKGLFQINSKLWTVASRTADVLIAFLEFALIQNVFPIFVNMMAVLTGEF